MSINVTPIPRLIDLAAPAFTLGTANAAGSAVTAVASDATLLAFDTTDPAAVAASAVVGSATVAARRDHVHPGTTGAGTVVDDAITRFNGTGGSSLQGYSSLSPTISDTGIISLTSGALKFPATAISSGNANTLDDYEEGTWTPSIADSSHDGTGEGQVYSLQAGFYTAIGREIFITGRVVISNLGTMTTSSHAFIEGLPFTPARLSTVDFGESLSLNITAGYSIAAVIPASNARIDLFMWDAATGTTIFLISELSAGADISFSGHYTV